jgi:hypothetical protein
MTSGQRLLYKWAIVSLVVLLIPIFIYMLAAAIGVLSGEFILFPVAVITGLVTAGGALGAASLIDILSNDSHE